MKVDPISWKSDGWTIRGELYSPDGQSDPVPALVLCHGIPVGARGLEDRGYPLLAERFCGEGFAVLTFNFRGAGRSEGNFDILGWAADLEEALKQLTARPEVDPRRIFVMGFSAGAAVAVYVAARRAEIAGLVLCASPAFFRGLSLGQGLNDLIAHARSIGLIKDPDFPPSTAEWEKGFAVVKPIQWIGRIPPRPLLILHGASDQVVDPGHARELYARVEGKADFQIIEGAAHQLRLEDRAMAKALGWLKSKAFNDPSSAQSA